MKSRLWQKQAEEMGLDADMIETWFRSMRMRYGKLTKANKSGDPAADPTDHEAFIL